MQLVHNDIDAKLNELGLNPQLIECIITDHTDFVEYYRNHPNVDFIYSRFLSCYLVNIKAPLHHTKVMAALYKAAKPETQMSASSYWCADAFIDEDMGFFKSTAGARIYHAKSYFPIPELCIISSQFRPL